MRWQTTIENAVGEVGIGLHTGLESRLWIRPAPVDHGIIFHHRAKKVFIPAQVDHAQKLGYATRLGLGDVAVSTVEHLLSALCGLGIDNALIEFEGEEIPILDGSAMPFVDLIDTAGIRKLDRPVTAIRMTRPIEVRDGEKWMRVEPADAFSVDYRISFDNPIVGYQRYVGVITPEVYRESIAPARTFGFLKDVTYLKSRGLALGGSFTNCVVVDDRQVVSGELRFPDEFVRHKVLDLIGDLALLEYPLVGTVIAHKAGHALHAAFVREILAHPECWEIVGSESSGAFVMPYSLDIEAPAVLAM
ncbi:MAG: UDP-3-O-[3-hydroxymyristoyl] N-acetylglucosamine deacetylase [Acidobacteria bacterium]|nr:UDP-3-O-[3-hydroxymyristoyl] N-acetylglucosamine deacetylase [Acidobacteriota bacterium]